AAGDASYFRVPAQRQRHSPGGHCRSGRAPGYGHDRDGLPEGNRARTAPRRRGHGPAIHLTAARLGMSVADGSPPGSAVLGTCLTVRRMRGGRVRCMPAFVLRLIAPRPNFAQTLTDEEREIMNRHAAHWRPYLERGDMVVFGPILTEDDSYGLAVVETDDEQ